MAATVPGFERSQLSLMDDMGVVFIAPDRVLRAVYPSAATMVDALLRSGLPDALASRGLMPATRRSEISMPGYAFVLEHPRLPFVTYPFEWSYGMLCAAAALVLEVNELANAYGYELQDCHGYNLLFDGPRPCYVDLGSLIPRPTGARGWVAREQFVRAYVYPLQIWASGGEFIARRLSVAGDLLSHADYGLYRWPWLRWGGAETYQRMMDLWHRYRRLSHVPVDKIRDRLPAPWAGLVCALKNRALLPAQTAGMAGLRSRVRRRPRRGPHGLWSNYQTKNAGFVDTPRFRRIIELVRRVVPGSVLELAGNQGRLAEALLRAGVATRALSTDFDERAVDQAYERVRVESGTLHVAVLNFIHPMTNPYRESAAARMKADTVLALAVTHHLLLTQRVPVKAMLRTIATFTRRGVMVEFMPLGLWDGRQAPPLPDWYSLDWFRAAFQEEFELWHEEQLEENRHLFCGWLRSGVGTI